MTALARMVPLVLALLAGRAALAAPIDDAKRAFAEGKAAFERGDYESALVAYQRANTILPAPNLYYNIGATYERLGRYQEAALAFDKYFETAGAPRTNEERQFQAKLRARTEADRQRVDLPSAIPAPAAGVPSAPAEKSPPPPETTAGSPRSEAPAASPSATPAAATTPARPPLSLDAQLRDAKGRRTRAIVLMAIGVPLSVAGVITLGWAAGAPDLDVVSRWGGGFVGFTFAAVGVSLWAPGVASFVHSTRDLRRLRQAPPASPPSL